MLIPYKNRCLDLSKPVEMYRCLNRRGFTFSIRQNGKVVAHTTNIVLKECEFIVNPAGKNRCIKNKVRNVHAYVKGYVGTKQDIKLTFSHILRYNSFIPKGFHYSIGGENIEITNCELLYFQDNSIYIQV